MKSNLLAFPMNFFRFCLLIVCLLSGVQILFAQDRAEVIKDEYLIQFDPTVTQARRANNAYSTLNNGEVASHVRVQRSSSTLAASTATGSQIVNLDSDLVDADCAEIKKANPAVRTCEPNYVQYNAQTFPNDTFFGSQFWHFSQFANGITLFDARSPFGWNFSQGSDNVILAVLDSGINYFHPDLFENLWRNPNETPNDGVDNDGNGYVDDVVGIDAFNGTGNPLDCNGHGSHVAGIMGARGNNNRGVTGVMWRTKILSIKQAVDCGPSVSTAAVIKGIEYLVNLKRRTGANIVAVNASYAGSNRIQAEFDAIRSLASVNIVFVAAAGNDGVNIDITPRFPGAHESDNLVTVANLDTAFSFPNVLNSSSNFGSGHVHLGAPGTDILSTVEPRGVAETYDRKDGTSMAAPVVTGAFGLYAAHRPQLYSYKRRIDVLLASVFPVPALNGVTRTGGTIDLGSLLSRPELADNCPSDPVKADPLFCGCNQPENFSDGDGDSTPDCADSCPSDPGKTAPGTCGCGVSDSDSDGDGVLSCQEQCPNDPAKTAAGVCGCGSPDADSNGNGQLDCLDAQIAAVTPKAPKLSIKNGKLLIKMQQFKKPRLSYLIKIVNTKKVGNRNKVSTQFKSSGKPELSLKLAAKGTKLSISYQYVYPGKVFASANSAGKKYTIK